MGSDDHSGGRAKGILATKICRGSSQSSEAARLPRNGEKAVILTAREPTLREHAEEMGEAKGRGSGRAKRVVRIDADSGLASTLRERFALTRMEAVVACGLADGLTYEEIADRCGISYHTVHSHVKAIHQKAGVSSNTRLLALIRKLGLG